MPCTTPVVFIIFRRPETTAKVFEAIRQAQPKKLFIISDGPRIDRQGEAEKCVETRSIVEQINWDCEVFKRYSETNLGCGINVPQGISWVFEQVEEAIILEDDCLPSPEFFPFCEQLLAKYRDDERIMSICGTNYLQEWIRSDLSYHFTQFSGIWGWATWRRAWNLYDYEMKLFPQAIERRFLDGFFVKPIYRLFWEDLFTRLYDDPTKMNTWDYQWQFARWVQNGLGITPEVNLISNIGFGSEGTHTLEETPFANLKTKKLEFPLKHSPLMVRDTELDDLIQKKFFGKYVKSNLKNKAIASFKTFIRKSIAKR
jgi:hypothetical protein